ncbi:hypothetical protein AOLI_G00126150 [Acnodon oligacanthus]
MVFPACPSDLFSHLGLQLQSLLAQPWPLLTAPPAIPPSDARLFNPPLVSFALCTRILQAAPTQAQNVQQSDQLFITETDPMVTCCWFYNTYA